MPKIDLFPRSIEKLLFKKSVTDIINQYTPTFSPTIDDTFLRDFVEPIPSLDELTYIIDLAPLFIKEKANELYNFKIQQLAEQGVNVDEYIQTLSDEKLQLLMKTCLESKSTSAESAAVIKKLIYPALWKIINNIMTKEVPPTQKLDELNAIIPDSASSILDDFENYAVEQQNIFTQLQELNSEDLVQRSRLYNKLHIGYSSRKDYVEQLKSHVIKDLFWLRDKSELARYKDDETNKILEKIEMMQYLSDSKFKADIPEEITENRQDQIKTINSEISHLSKQIDSLKARIRKNETNDFNDSKKALGDSLSQQSNLTTQVSNLEFKLNQDKTLYKEWSNLLQGPLKSSDAQRKHNLAKYDQMRKELQNALTKNQSSSKKTTSVLEEDKKTCLNNLYNPFIEYDGNKGKYTVTLCHFSSSDSQFQTLLKKNCANQNLKTFLVGAGNASKELNLHAFSFMTIEGCNYDELKSSFEALDPDQKTNFKTSYEKLFPTAPKQLNDLATNDEDKIRIHQLAELYNIKSTLAKLNLFSPADLNALDDISLKSRDELIGLHIRLYNLLTTLTESFIKEKLQSPESDKLLEIINQAQKTIESNEIRKDKKQKIEKIFQRMEHPLIPSISQAVELAQLISNEQTLAAPTELSDSKNNIDSYIQSAQTIERIIQKTAQGKPLVSEEELRAINEDIENIKNTLGVNYRDCHFKIQRDSNCVKIYQGDTFSQKITLTHSSRPFSIVKSAGVDGFALSAGGSRGNIVPLKDIDKLRYGQSGKKEKLRYFTNCFGLGYGQYGDAKIYFDPTNGIAHVIKQVNTMVDEGATKSAFSEFAIKHPFLSSYTRKFDEPNVEIWLNQQLNLIQNETSPNSPYNRLLTTSIEQKTVPFTPSTDASTGYTTSSASSDSSPQTPSKGIKASSPQKRSSKQLVNSSPSKQKPAQVIETKTSEEGLYSVSKFNVVKMEQTLAPGKPLSTYNNEQNAHLSPYDLKFHNPTTRLDEKALIKESIFMGNLAKGIIQAACELKALGFTHNDIKPENLLFKNDKVSFIDINTGGFLKNHDRADRDSQSETAAKILGCNYNELKETPKDGKMLYTHADGRFVEFAGNSYTYGRNPVLNIVKKDGKQQCTLSYLYDVKQQVEKKEDRRSQIETSEDEFTRLPADNEVLDDWALLTMIFGVCHKESYFNLSEGRKLQPYLISDVIKTDATSLKLEADKKFNDFFAVPGQDALMYIPSSKTEGEPLHFYRRLLFIKEKLALQNTNENDRITEITHIIATVNDAVTNKNPLLKETLRELIEQSQKIFVDYSQIKQLHLQQAKNKQFDEVTSSEFEPTKELKGHKHLEILCFYPQNQEQTKKAKALLTESIIKQSLEAPFNELLRQILLHHQADIFNYIIEKCPEDAKSSLIAKIQSEFLLNLCIEQHVDVGPIIALLESSSQLSPELFTKHPEGNFTTTRYNVLELAILNKDALLLKKILTLQIDDAYLNIALNMAAERKYIDAFEVLYKKLRDKENYPIPYEELFSTPLSLKLFNETGCLNDKLPTTNLYTIALNAAKNQNFDGLFFLIEHSEKEWIKEQPSNKKGILYHILSAQNPNEVFLAFEDKFEDKDLLATFMSGELSKEPPHNPLGALSPDAFDKTCQSIFDALPKDNFETYQSFIKNFCAYAKSKNIPHVGEFLIDKINGNSVLKIEQKRALFLALSNLEHLQPRITKKIGQLTPTEFVEVKRTQIEFEHLTEKIQLMELLEHAKEGLEQRINEVSKRSEILTNDLYQAQANSEANQIIKIKLEKLISDLNSVRSNESVQEVINAFEAALTICNNPDTQSPVIYNIVQTIEGVIEKINKTQQLEFDSRLNELERKNTELSEQVGSIQELLDQKNKENEQLNEDTKKQHIENQALEKQIEGAKEKLKNLMATHENTTKQKSLEIQELQETIVQHKNTIESNERALMQQEELLSKNIEEIKKLNQQLQSTQEEQEKTQEELNKLQLKNAELEETIAQNANKIGDLNKHLEQSRKNNSQLQEKNIELETVFSQKTDELENLKKAINDIGSSSATDATSNLSTPISALKSRFDTLSNEVKRVSLELSANQELLVKSKENNSALNLQKQELELKNQQLQEQLRDLNETKEINETQKEEITQLNLKLLISEEKIAQLQGSQNNQLEHALKENEKLKKELSNKTSEALLLLLENSALNDKAFIDKEQYESELSSLKREMEDLLNANIEVQTQLHEEKRKNNTLTTNNEYLENESQNLSAQISDKGITGNLSLQVSLLLGQLETKDKKIHQIQKEFKTLEEAMTSIKGPLLEQSDEEEIVISPPSLAQQAQELTKLIERIKEQQNEQMASITKEQSKITNENKAQIAQLEEINLKLQNEKLALNAKVKELLDTLENSNSKELQNIAGEFVDVDMDASNTKINLDGLTYKVGLILQRIKELEEENKTLKDENKEKSLEKIQLDSKLADANTKIKHLENSIRVNNTTFETHYKKIANEHAEKLRNIEQDASLNQKKFKEKLLAHYQKELSEITKKFGAQNQSLYAQLELAQAELDELKSNLEQLSNSEKRQNAFYASRIHAIQEQLSIREEEFLGQVELLNHLSEETDSQSRTIQEQSLLNSKLQEKQIELMELNKKLSANLNKLTLEKETTSYTKQRLLNENQSLTKVINASEQIIGKLSNGIKQISQENQNLSSFIDFQQQKLDTQQLEIRKQHNHLIGLHTDFHKIDKQLQETHERNIELEHQLAEKTLEQRIERYDAVMLALSNGNPSDIEKAFSKYYLSISHEILTVQSDLSQIDATSVSNTQELKQKVLALGRLYGEISIILDELKKIYSSIPLNLQAQAQAQAQKLEQCLWVLDNEKAKLQPHIDNYNQILAEEIQEKISSFNTTRDTLSSSFSDNASQISYSSYSSLMSSDNLSLLSLLRAIQSNNDQEKMLKLNCIDKISQSMESSIISDTDEFSRSLFQLQKQVDELYTQNEDEDGDDISSIAPDSLDGSNALLEQLQERLLFLQNKLYIAQVKNNETQPVTLEHFIRLKDEPDLFYRKFHENIDYLIQEILIDDVNIPLEPKIENFFTALIHSEIDINEIFEIIAIRLVRSLDIEAGENNPSLIATTTFLLQCAKYQIALSALIYELYCEKLIENSFLIPPEITKAYLRRLSQDTRDDPQHSQYFLNILSHTYDCRLTLNHFDAPVEIGTECLIDFLYKAPERIANVLPFIKLDEAEISALKEHIFKLALINSNLQESLTAEALNSVLSNLWLQLSNSENISRPFVPQPIKSNPSRQERLADIYQNLQTLNYSSLEDAIAEHTEFKNLLDKAFDRYKDLFPKDAIPLWTLEEYNSERANKILAQMKTFIDRVCEGVPSKDEVKLLESNIRNLSLNYGIQLTEQQKEQLKHQIKKCSSPPSSRSSFFTQNKYPDSSINDRSPLSISSYGNNSNTQIDNMSPEEKLKNNLRTRIASSPEIIYALTEEPFSKKVDYNNIVCENPISDAQKLHDLRSDNGLTIYAPTSKCPYQLQKQGAQIKAFLEHSQEVPDKEKLALTIMNMIENVLSKGNQVNIRTEDLFAAKITDLYVNFLRSDALGDKKLDIVYQTPSILNTDNDTQKLEMLANTETFFYQLIGKMNLAQRLSNENIPWFEKAQEQQLHYKNMDRFKY